MHWKAGYMHWKAGFAVLSIAIANSCLHSVAVCDDPFGDDPFTNGPKANVAQPVDAAELLGKNPIDRQPESEPTFADADHQLATERGHAVHRQLAQFGGLSSLYIKAMIRTGSIESMKRVNARSVPLLNYGLDQPIGREGSSTYWSVFAWDPDQLWFHERHRLKNGSKHAQDLIWTGGKGYLREQTGAHQAKFHVRDSRELLMRRFEFGWLPYQKLGSHRFSWVDPSVTPIFKYCHIDPDVCRYRMLPVEEFGGESCDTIQCDGRAERFWISKKTGRLRGALIFDFEINGNGKMVDIYETETAKQLLPKSLNMRGERNYWYHGLPWSEQSKMLSARSEANFRKHAVPDLLIRFSDYRQVAPDVVLPFYQEAIRCHKNGAGFNFDRFETRLASVDADMELTPSITHLMPEYDDAIIDRMTYVDASHVFRQLPRHKDDEQLSKARVVAAMNEALGSRAPTFFEESWAWQDKIELDGAPYLLYFFDFANSLCREQLVAISHATKKSKMRVVGIHVGEYPKSRVAQISQHIGIRIPIIHAPAPEPDDGPNRLPHGLLVDKHGVIRKHLAVGEILDEVSKR